MMYNDNGLYNFLCPISANSTIPWKKVQAIPDTTKLMTTAINNQKNYDVVSTILSLEALLYFLLMHSKQTLTIG